MSIWGTGIFQGDVAQDIRDTYRGMLLDKVPDDEAEARIVDEFAEVLDHPDDGALFTIALAVTMHKVGRLTEPIRARALAAIDAGPEPWWENEKDLAARARVFATTRELLTSEQPAPKRLSRPWEENTTLVPGDVLALATDAGYGLLRVARLEKTRFGAYPVVVTLDYRGATVPTPDELDAIPDLVKLQVWYDPKPPRALPSGQSITRYRKREADYADVGFAVVGRVMEREGDATLHVGGGSMWGGAAAFMSDGSWYRSIAQGNDYAAQFMGPSDD